MLAEPSVSCLWSRGGGDADVSVPDSSRLRVSSTARGRPRSSTVTVAFAGMISTEWGGDGGLRMRDKMLLEEVEGIAILKLSARGVGTVTVAASFACAFGGEVLGGGKGDLGCLG